jgi:RND family efflux transporter MFP subunit
VALAAVVVLSWLVYQRLAEPQDAGRPRGAQRPVAVEVEAVRQRPMRDVAMFTGTVIPLNRIVVRPRVSGRLEQLLVDIGDPVRNGQLVAVLDGEEFRQAVAQATAELRVAEANLVEARSARNLAQRDYERVAQLREEKVASEADLDEALARQEAAAARYQVVEAQIQQKQAALKAAQVRLGYTRIAAEWSQDGDGQERYVAERFTDIGAVLRVDDPIISIVNVDPVVAVVNVIERDYPGIDVGQLATIENDAWPSRTFTGTVTRKAPILREESRQARVEIEVPNPELRLAPGMFVRVRLELASVEAATAVPSAAVVRREDQQGVFVVDRGEGKVSFVPVTTGITEGQWVQIVEPALEGEVVKLGQHLLSDGAAVSVAGSGASSTTRPAGPAGQRGQRR